jgi:hypothetical protein
VDGVPSKFVLRVGTMIGRNEHKMGIESYVSGDSMTDETPQCVNRIAG